MRTQRLGLVEEAAGHPFRRSLAPRALADGWSDGGARTVEPLRGGAGPRFSLQDLREFLMAYCACFLAVSVFIL
jgi:hypothetical protein